MVPVFWDLCTHQHSSGSLRFPRSSRKALSRGPNPNPACLQDMDKDIETQTLVRRQRDMKVERIMSDVSQVLSIPSPRILLFRPL